MNTTPEGMPGAERHTGSGPSAPASRPTEATALKLLHELQVHQEELAQQNAELQDARADLAASLTRYVELYETAPVGLVTVDHRGVVRHVNGRGQALLSEVGHGLLGHSLLESVAPESRDALQRAITEPHAPSTSRGVEVLVRLPAGDRRVLHAELRSRTDEDDGILVALTDVTARKQAQDDLAHTRAILELSNRIARIGFWELDAASMAMTWSTVVREIHQVGADYTPNFAASIGFCKAGASRDRLQAAMAAAIERAEPFDLELQITLAGGQGLWVRQIGIAEFEAGRCRRVYGTFQDVDSRAQAEGARLAQARAEMANRSKSAFLARMSHDLRTPLNAVLGFSQLLERNVVVRGSEGVLRQVQHIHGAGEHLLAMIDDVLDLARMESGDLRLKSEIVAAGPLAAECVAMLAPLAARHGITLHLTGEAQALCVTGDRTRLRQVVVNLVTNAIKYNREAGRVEVMLSASAADVVIAIRDTGKGLAPAQIAELFQPFNRLGAEASGIEGTGLGLVISRQLVEAMHGTIEVSSTPAQGSVFTVTLPRAADAQAVPPIDAEAAETTTIGLLSGPFVVLYIEDNPVNAELMRYALSLRPGIVLEVATDGDAGVEAARRLQPNLLLLDMNLPGLDGLGVLARLREEAPIAAFPCVAVSANAMASDIQRALDAGCTDYITKPFEVRRVLDLVDRMRR